MRYLSLFSGIGGLESSSTHPVLCCEADKACRAVLAKRFGEIEFSEDVVNLRPPHADVIVGGWPCQDISIAGTQLGLEGARSGLFYEMLRVAAEAKAHTIVAENVPNLLKLQKGKHFAAVLRAFEQSGFPYIAWRTLNAREFGLPHERRRVFLVATKIRDAAIALFRNLPMHDKDYLPISGSDEPPTFCNGFYWTAGLQSICYSSGFVPTLKVGSSLSIPSPPALHFDGCVRKATASECLRFQGFDPAEFVGVPDKEVYRMTGNAVAAPVGKFAVDSILVTAPEEPLKTAFSRIGEAGLYEKGEIWEIGLPRNRLGSHLRFFVDSTNCQNLSVRAASGLLSRLLRSGKQCPASLLALLYEISGVSPQHAPTVLEGRRSEKEYPQNEPESRDNYAGECQASLVF